MFFYQIIEMLIAIVYSAKEFLKDWSVADAFEMSIEVIFMVKDGYSKEDAVQAVVSLQHLRNEFGIPLPLSELADYFTKFVWGMKQVGTTNFDDFFDDVLYGMKQTGSPDFDEIFKGFFNLVQSPIMDIIANAAINLDYQLDYDLSENCSEFYDKGYGRFDTERIDWALGREFNWKQFDAYLKELEECG